MNSGATKQFLIHFWAGLPPFLFPAPTQSPTDLHMLDFRELELLGDEGGVWYDQL